MKVLVVDDEPLARQRAKIQLEQLGHQDILEAENGEQALLAVRQHQPHLMIMDIQMPGLNGLDVAKTLLDYDNPPALIFATAWDQYALGAFDVNAAAYLLKPYSKQQLEEAINKATQLNRLQLNVIKETKETASIIVSQGSNKEKINLEDVFYLHSEDKYTVLYCNQGQRILEQSLKELEGLYEGLLLRIHRSYLVNKSKIQRLTKDVDGGHSVYIENHPEALPVSRRLLKDVKAVLN